MQVALIKKFGNNFSFFITPPLFALAGTAWFFVGKLGHESPSAAKGLAGVEQQRESYGTAVLHGARAFGRSTYKGAVICFSSRRYIWLIPGYSFALYGHRYLENGLMPLIAKRVMKDSSYSQIMFVSPPFLALDQTSSDLVFTRTGCPDPTSESSLVP